MHIHLDFWLVHYHDDIQNYEPFSTQEWCEISIFQTVHLFLPVERVNLTSLTYETWYDDRN